jgi:hypothetical protein
MKSALSCLGQIDQQSLLPVHPPSSEKFLKINLAAHRNANELVVIRHGLSLLLSDRLIYIFFILGDWSLN